MIVFCSGRKAESYSEGPILHLLQTLIVYPQKFHQYSAAITGSQQSIGHAVEKQH